MVYIQWTTTQSLKKKNEILPSAATWADLKGITQRKTKTLYDMIYTWNLKN